MPHVSNVRAMTDSRAGLDGLAQAAGRIVAQDAADAIAAVIEANREPLRAAVAAVAAAVAAMPLAQLVEQIAPLIDRHHVEEPPCRN